MLRDEWWCSIGFSLKRLTRKLNLAGIFSFSIKWKKYFPLSKYIFSPTCCSEIEFGWNSTLPFWTSITLTKYSFICSWSLRKKLESVHSLCHKASEPPINFPHSDAAASYLRFQMVWYLLHSLIFLIENYNWCYKLTELCMEYDKISVWKNY